MNPKILIAIVAIVLGIIAAATKPDENTLCTAVGAKNGVLSGLGALAGHVTGISPIKYHDYLLFSTETRGTDTIATGYFGHVSVN